MKHDFYHGWVLRHMPRLKEVELASCVGDHPYSDDFENGHVPLLSALSKQTSIWHDHMFTMFDDRPNIDTTAAPALLYAISKVEGHLRLSDSMQWTMSYGSYLLPLIFGFLSLLAVSSVPLGVLISNSLYQKISRNPRKLVQPSCVSSTSFRCSRRFRNLYYAS